MTGVTALFWDLGGVVLSNGWDRQARSRAASLFGLEEEDFERRHREMADTFETGQVTLANYLQRTVFYRPRSFPPEQFFDFICEQSTEKHDTRAVLDELSAAGRYAFATINNESEELNSYRIRKFDLTRNFTAFFTSCYLRVRKPQPAIYSLALAISQRRPEESIFIDDRPENLDPARRLGMRVILFQNAVQLRAELAQHGVHP